MATARLADEAGFAFALISDHQGESPFVWSVLGAIANVIRRLRFPKPDFTPATYTILNFEVPDIEAAVDQLTSNGIEMERYEGFDEKGIARMPEAPVGAWFTDPAGNILCVHEPMPI